MYPAAPPPAVPWLMPRHDGVSLSVRVQPRAGRDEIAGVHGDALKIKLRSAPVDGKANADLLRFLADKLGTAPAALSILRGDTARQKVIRVTGVSAADVVRRLQGQG